MHKWWAHHPKFQNKHNKSSNEIWIWIRNDIKSNEFDFFFRQPHIQTFAHAICACLAVLQTRQFLMCTQHILECNFCFSFKSMWSFFSVHLFANDWFMCDVQILHFFLLVWTKILKIDHELHHRCTFYRKSQNDNLFLKKDIISAQLTCTKLFTLCVSLGF